jgi:hypothetical protein
MIHEHQMREYIEIARAYGYRLAVGHGWLSGALNDRCCCPMGAVVLAQRRGNPFATGTYDETAARALRCTEIEVREFVWGYDGRAGHEPNVALGRKLRAEVLSGGSSRAA